MQSDDDAQILREFLLESHDNLDNADRDLIALEDAPTDRALLDNVFRAFHTLKGSSGFLNYPGIESLTHRGESLLARARDGHLLVDESVATALLRTVDAIRKMLSSIEQTGSEGDPEHEELVALIESIEARPPLSSADPANDGEQEASANAPPGPTDGNASLKAATECLRINVAQLDRLMNLVGELVLARNQILQFRQTEPDTGFGMTMQRLNLITTDLQEEVMKTRMQPISTVWSKIPRVVRDLARICNKQVHVTMDGKETELDKTILETIRDPLTHIVRNSIDHGIEPPATREANGKTATGTIALKAYHEGGQVVIEIADDGAGIDPARIAEVALSRGLLPESEIARMSETEIINLIFAPGFSSSETVSKVSGRGVGMDVVRTNIEQIGGTLDIETTVGEGMKITFKIPLTLAIIPALLVASNGERFAVPQVNLVELVRVERDDATKSIEWINDVPVYRLRGRLLPLVYLSDVLGMERDREQDADSILVLQAEGTDFGLVVDEIRDTEEIVVKPLDNQLKSAQVYAGATILGDGRVGLILDVKGLAKRASLVSDTRRVDRDQLASKLARDSSATSRSSLLVRHGTGYNLTISLETIERIEEIPIDTVEYSGGREVVQYRDTVIPLIRLDEHLERRGAPSRNEDETLQVLVFATPSGFAGLVVDDIIDVTEGSSASPKRNDHSLLEGTAVVQSVVADVLSSQAVLSIMETGA